MNELPFELFKEHKSKTKYKWKQRGLIMDNFEEIYNKYIYATHCQLCNKQFKNRRDRHMEHDHQTGEFRNIVCCNCNHLKSDVKVRSHNINGYKNIHKQNSNRYKQGFTWQFYVNINGKRKSVKSCVNLDKLVKFAEQWKKDNNYHT